MSSRIPYKINSLKGEIPDHVELVAVSKYFPASDIQIAYDAGQRIFGESRAQELLQKQAMLPQDIEWHFIGHLQPNKVKYIAPFVQLIHAVDSEKLLAEIDKQGRKCEREIPCLLQLHVAQEETKYGFSIDECREMLERGEWRKYVNARICGVMCMASNTDDMQRVRADFRAAKTFFDELKETYFKKDSRFCKCSWGMSGDYPVAIEEGANLIRVGSLIFS